MRLKNPKSLRKCLENLQAQMHDLQCFKKNTEISYNIE